MLKTAGLTSFILLLLVIPISSIAATTASNNDHTKSFWTNGSHIPTPRTEVSATAIGDSVYVIEILYMLLEALTHKDSLQTL